VFLSMKRRTLTSTYTDLSRLRDIDDEAEDTMRKILTLLKAFVQGIDAAFFPYSSGKNW
jgi:hypothetical protein